MLTVSAPFSSSHVAKQLDYCSYCPKMCRHACPVSSASGHETFIPQAKMDRLNQVRKGHAPWTADSTEPLWACTGCRHCTVYCDHGNEPGLVLLAGRAEATARGAGHPALAGYPERFRRRDQRLVAEMREQVDAGRRSDDALVGFWPGCDAIDKAPNDIDAALRVLEHLSGDTTPDQPASGPVRLPVKMVDIGQACAGAPLLAAGHTDEFRWHAGKVATGLKGFRTVVVGCATCVHAMRAWYPAEGVLVGPEILSVPEFLARSIARLPEARDKKIVYYHDPCTLARHVGVIEEPRQILSRIAEVRELGWSGKDTECCGGGGLLPKTMPDVADAMARRRLREVARGGGGTVVTACPTCAFMLKRNAPDGVDVKPLVELLAKALADMLAGADAGTAEPRMPPV